MNNDGYKEGLLRLAHDKIEDLELKLGVQYDTIKRLDEINSSLLAKNADLKRSLEQMRNLSLTPPTILPGDILWVKDPPTRLARIEKGLGILMVINVLALIVSALSGFLRR